jgi:hypothetical protein
VNQTISTKNEFAQECPVNDIVCFLGSESITYHSGTDHITIEPPGMEFSTICAYAKVVLIYFTNVSDTDPRGSAFRKALLVLLDPVPDPDRALFVSGFQDADKKKFFSRKERTFHQ